MAFIVGEVVAPVSTDSTGFVEEMKKIKKQGEEVSADITKRFQNLGDSMQKTGKSLTAYVTVPLMAIGAAAFKSADTVEQGMANIISITGKTGEELEEMRKIFLATFKTVPDSADAISEVLSRLNVSTGAVGDELQNLTKLTLDYARANKEDAGQSTDVLGRLINGLGKEVSDLPKYMNQLTKASQMSGISVNQLSEYIIGAGPAFEELGYDVEKSIALFSSFYKAGAEPAEVVSSLNKVITGLAAEGLTDVEQGFQDLLDSIKNAPTLLEGVSIAVEAFGARAGANIADDIRAGRFAVEDWVEALQDSEGAVESTAAGMMTWRQELALFKNQAETSFAPLGKPLVEMLSGILQHMAPVIEMVGNLATKFNNLDPNVQKTIIGIAGIVAAIGPALIITGTLTKHIGELIGGYNKLAPAINRLSTSVLPALGKGVTSLISSSLFPWIIAIGAVIAIGVLLYKNWETIREKAVEIWADVVKSANTLWAGTKKAFDVLWKGIQEFFYSFLRGGILGLINDYILKPFFNIDLREVGKNIVKGLADGIKSMVGKVGEAISSVTSRIRDYLPFSPAKLGALRKVPNFDSILLTPMERVLGEVDGLLDRRLRGFDFAPFDIGIGGSGLGTGGISSSQIPIVYVKIEGDIYGLLDFEDKVKSTIREALQGGAFRGILPVV